jgi:hypothetical protein
MEEKKTGFHKNDWITSKDANIKNRSIYQVTELPFTMRLSALVVPYGGNEIFHLPNFRYATANEIKKEKIRRMFKIEEDSKSKYI